MRYVLTNYTVQCTDETSGKKGCFIFDLARYETEGKFYALSPVFTDLDELYKGTKPNERTSCYIEYKGAL